jgi:Arc/MetJ-type ribon-helix-helix transcriptional regulator
MRYDFGMTRQITVRLHEELVEFVDALVAEGVVESRAQAVALALTRERRRRTALHDAEILRGAATDPELDAVAAFAGAHPVDLGD